MLAGTVLSQGSNGKDLLPTTLSVSVGFTTSEVAGLRTSFLGWLLVRGSPGSPLHQSKSQRHHIRKAEISLVT